MAKEANLQSFYDESLKCVRCGLCQAVCPVYAVERHESAVARGKVQIVRALLEERIEPSSPARERLFLCLNCEACTANCPSGVEVTDVILAGRAQMMEDLGQPAVERIVLREVLAHPARMELGAAALALYQRTGLRWLAQKSGVLRALPGGLAEKEALLPAYIDAKPARRSIARPRAEAPARARVAYFLGCVTNVMYPSVAQSLVQVLEHNGCQVAVPDGLRCCGMPHRNYGDLPTARALEQQNTEALNAADFDAIVTDCATCSSTLRGYQGLKAPVYDINQFLVDQLGFTAPDRPLPTRVTYHDPCHLARGQGVRTAPRKVMQAVPELELIEMAEADRCCGGAGTFALTHHDVSMQILDRKIANAAATDADILTTGCPACRMQLSHGLTRYAGGQGPREVLHPVELLARAYGAS